jgi:hypothetical protein
MRNFTHFYARYGLALVMSEKAVSSFEDLNAGDFDDVLEKNLLKFRLKVIGDWKGKETVGFQFAKLKEGNPSRGIFLSPNVITSDKGAQGLWVKIEEFQRNLRKQPSVDFYKSESAKQGFAPTAGEYNNGKASRQTANIPFIEAVCCAITTTTADKPAFINIDSSGNKVTLSNTTILPDLPLDELRAFINVFKEVSKRKTDNLLEGKVKKEKNGEKPSRPTIIRGNFPNAPKSNSLRALGLLGAIGEWAKEAEYDRDLSERVLKSLENCPIYMISPDTVKITKFNHFVVGLARENRLGSIINSLYYVAPFILAGESDLKKIEREREKVAFFASRFLHLFDEMSFREFLAIRAEYPYQLETLFKSFFMQKNIDPEIIRSAKALGAWLNQVAYKVANAEDKNNIRELKAKVLVELESSAFSAKSGTALIGQTVTRAGRLSKMDAPSESDLFMEKAMSGEIDLKDAQQMLMAFSRLRNKFDNPVTSEEDIPEEDTDEAEDFSDAQDND